MRSDSASRRRSAGFTLIELLVAITILAIVAVLGWRGLDSIVRSRLALNGQLDQTRALQLTFAQLQSDCSHVVNPLNYPNLPEGRSSWIQPQKLILIRSVYYDDQAPAMQFVTYQMRDSSLTRFESVPTRDLRTLAQMLDQARNPPDQQTEITMVTRVQSIDFAGYPLDSLNGSALEQVPASQPNAGPGAGGQTPVGGNVSASAAASAPAQNGQQPNVPQFNQSKVTTGLQVSLQLSGHDQTMLKIFILGGA